MVPVPQLLDRQDRARAHPCADPAIRGFVGAQRGISTQCDRCCSLEDFNGCISHTIQSSTRQMVQLMVDGRCPPGWRDGARRQERTGNDRPVAAAGYKPKRVIPDPTYSMTNVLY